ncbi:processed acidic surface protein [Bacillus sp. CGMCC 1.16607]|uniref:processed acidic surface protein n=1 Tax=Bacillus sp. CGMCC 1.16607 TaxID=3351842 RepID=UPI0036261A41
MNFIRAFLIYLISFQLLFSASSALAAPPENELNAYLAQIGWTKQELLDYLDYYEIPLNEFESVEDLKMFLGTPINSENLQELLTRYNLTEKELQDLLNHFGDSLAEYKFIEDLDVTVDFYVNHDEYMADIENELAEIGITEEESERFFEYLSLVEEKNKDQLDQMYMMDSNIEKFMDVTDTSELTDEELDELVQILTESISLYEIQVKFKVDQKEISLKELLKMKELPKNLLTTIYSNSGELLIDFTVPEWLIEPGEEMIHIGELSDEYVDYLHEEKYEEASEKGYK